MRVFSKFLLVLLIGCTNALVFLNAPAAQSKGAAQPQDVKNFYGRVHVALRSDKWKDGLALCHDYLAKHKTDAMARAIRGYLLLETNNEALALTDLNAAMAAGVTAIPVSIAEIHSNNLLSLRGFAEMRLGRLKEGIADIEKSLEKEPESIAVYCNQRIDFANLATAYQKLNNRSKADHYAQMAEARDREIQLTFHAVLTRESDIAREAKELEAYLACHPNNSVKSALAAADFVRLKKYGQALNYINKTLAAEPYLMHGRLLRFHILQELHRQDEGQADLDEIMRYVERPTGNALTAGDRMALAARLVEIYRKSGNLDAQIRLFERLADSGNAGESQLYDLGQCYCLKKQWAKAIEAYDQALEYAVDNRPLIYEGRARAHEMLGQIKEAKADKAEADRLKHKSRKI